MDVFLTDDLPGNVIFISGDEGENICDLEPGQVVECYLVDLLPGVSTQVQVFVEPEEAGTLTNTAQVTSTVADPNLANNQDSVTTTVEGGEDPTNPGDDPGATSFDPGNPPFDPGEDPFDPDPSNEPDACIETGTSSETGTGSETDICMRLALSAPESITRIR